MGLRTIVLDMNPQAEGMRLAHRAVSISTRDIDGCVRIARALKKEGFTIDGVVTVGTDASMAVASIAHALDLPGIPYKVAQKATNKILMREALQQAGLPVMPFQAIYSLAEAREGSQEYWFASSHQTCGKYGFPRSHENQSSQRNQSCRSPSESAYHHWRHDTRKIFARP